MRLYEAIRPLIYQTTAQIATEVFVYTCCHIANEKKHNKKQGFTIVSTEYDLVDLLV